MLKMSIPIVISFHGSIRSFPRCLVGGVGVREGILGPGEAPMESSHGLGGREDILINEKIIMGKETE